ncbi:hypothetical protein [Nocardia sp. NPDC046763]|uniref:hypothetical protein n=1 Tax=Nocardia sp. NPDC046763 TaxID=3155256 RepID=UPI0033EC8F5D
MKRTAIGMIAMSGIALGVSLAPVAASAQAPTVTTVAGSPATGSAALPGVLQNTLLECLASGSAKGAAPGTPGSTGCPL